MALLNTMDRLASHTGQSPDQITEALKRKPGSTLEDYAKFVGLPSAPTIQAPQANAPAAPAPPAARAQSQATEVTPAPVRALRPAVMPAPAKGKPAMVNPAPSALGGAVGAFGGAAAGGVPDPMPQRLPSTNATPSMPQTGQAPDLNQMVGQAQNFADIIGKLGGGSVGGFASESGLDPKPIPETLPSLGSGAVGGELARTMGPESLPGWNGFSPAPVDPFQEALSAGRISQEQHSLLRGWNVGGGGAPGPGPGGTQIKGGGAGPSSNPFQEAQGAVPPPALSKAAFPAEPARQAPVTPSELPTTIPTKLPALPASPAAPAWQPPNTTIQNPAILNTLEQMLQGRLGADYKQSPEYQAQAADLQVEQQRRRAQEIENLKRAGNFTDDGAARLVDDRLNESFTRERLALDASSKQAQDSDLSRAMDLAGLQGQLGAQNVGYGLQGAQLGQDQQRIDAQKDQFAQSLGMDRQTLEENIRQFDTLDDREKDQFAQSIGLTRDQFEQAQREFKVVQTGTMDGQRTLAGGTADLNAELGRGQLGLGRDTLDLNAELGRGELGLRKDQFGLDAELGRGRLGLDTTLGQGRLGLDTELGRGDLDVRRGQLGINEDTARDNRWAAVAGGVFETLKTFPGLGDALKGFLGLGKDVADDVVAKVVSDLPKEAQDKLMDAAGAGAGAGAAGAGGAGATGAGAVGGVGTELGAGSVLGATVGGAPLVTSGPLTGLVGSGFTAPAGATMAAPAGQSALTFGGYAGGGAGAGVAGAAAGTAAATGGFAGAGGAGGIGTMGGASSTMAVAWPLAMFAISQLNGPAASDTTMYTAKMQIAKVDAAIDQQAREAGMTREQFVATLPPKAQSDLIAAQETIRNKEQEQMARSGGMFGGIDPTLLTPEMIANLRAQGMDL